MVVCTCGAAVLQVDNVLMSARNIEKLEVNFASAVRVYDVLRADKIVIEEEALAYLNVSCDVCL
jgi:ribosomal protein L4